VRVLLVCQDTGGNVGWSFRRLLPELGHQAEVVNEEQHFGALPSSLWRRGFKRLTGKPPGSWRFNREICRKARKFRPDLVLIFKGAYIEPSTLRRLRSETGAILVNYCLDDFFSLNPKGVTTQMRSCIPLWDLIATTKRYNVPELEGAGARRAVFVRCGYDPLVHYPVTLTPAEQGDWGSDALFIGTYEKERAERLEALAAQSQVNLRVYGDGWRKVSPRSPLCRHIQGRPLYGQEKRLALAGARIALAFLRKVNRDTYTDRSFEIPACGTFMLAERSDEHLLLYQEGEEIACFDTPEELLKKVQYYLSHPRERANVAKAGYQRLTRNGHTYEHRLKEILELVSHL
jgi:hypothetical protein